MEKEAAIQRSQAQANGEKGRMKYRDLVAAGEEDDAELMDQATIEDRNWDNWKDENPRGWGNKMGKRF
jgi:immunoglobulin-binding protein 1